MLHPTFAEAVSNSIACQYHRLSVIDHRLSVIDHRLSAIDHRLSVLDHRLSGLSLLDGKVITDQP